MKTNFMFNMRKLFTTSLFVGLFSFLGFSQLTVTKTYNPGSSVSIDGCGTYCTTLPGLTFSAADFTAGACTVTDVNVRIRWAKTDGTCASPGTANSYHSETNFRIDGPSNNVILAVPGTYTGTASTFAQTTLLDQAAATVIGGVNPVTGTFRPNNGNLNDFNGTSPFGTWTLRAGDTGGGDPLCIVWYQVTISVAVGGADPDVPTALVATPSSICSGLTSNLTWTGDLNDATQWNIYTGSCGGTLVGTSLTNSFTTPALAANTTFYIRGEDGPGGCVDESTGLCGQVDVTIAAQDDASYSYSAAAYCVDDTDPTPTITGLGGGTFSSGAGLSLNPGTGAIDVSASTPGTYTVTYTTSGACPNSSNTSVTINALDDASFSYSAAAFCVDDSDPTPTITGLAGGTFSSGAGLTLNASTGAIDVSTSTPGTYTVTYTTTGICPNSSSVSVTINALDDASFSYSAAAYCLGDSDPTPTITGLAGGTFSSLPAGLNINPTTGFINIGLSTPNSYTVTYTTSGACPNSSNVAVSIGTPLATPTVVSPITVCPGDDVVLTSTGTGTGSLIFFNTIPTPIGTVPMPPATGTLNIGALATGPYSFLVVESDGTCQSIPAVITATVGDVIPPTAVCQDINVYLDGTGNATIVAGDLDGGSTDNCGAVTLSASVTSFTCSNLGPQIVVLTVDDGNGNTDDCGPIVTVLDTISPTASCQDITVFLDGSGNASIVAADIDGGSSDNCTTVSLAADNTNFTCAETGPNTVTLTVTDGSGNSSTCTSMVTVLDTISPTASCQDITVFLDGAGMASIVAADIDNGSSDNCTVVTLAASVTAFTCADIGPNTVTLTVTDINGNVSTCTSTVTVSDSVSPIASCQDITVYLDGAGTATIVATDVDNGSGDNCSVGSLSITPSTFTCAEVGANTVTLLVTDVNGNTATCTSTVTVSDTISPTASCQDITLFLDGTGNVTFTAADLDNGSTDNCTTVTLASDFTAFTCADLGANTVVLTVTDGSGNTSTCTSTVTVSDTISPSAICQNLNLILDGSGNASLVAADIDNGSTDNCGSVTLSASQLAFTCADLGTNSVTLTVNDGNGNTSTCISTVTITDDENPTITCATPAASYDVDAGTCALAVTDASLDPTFADNCTATVVNNITGTNTLNGASFGLGTTNVVWLVTDGAGNTATCNYNMVVVDAEAPIAICQDITIQLDASGNATIVPAQIDNGSTDNCSIGGLSVSPNTFTCAEVGANTVTLTVLDNAGNSTTCTSTVTVEDNVAPTAICQPVTAYLTAGGTVSISSSDFDNGSTDNCGLVSFSGVPTFYNCATVSSGPIPVLLQVIDANGNTSTCPTTITVLDTISPTAVCQDITVTLDAAGNATIVAADIDGGSSDNCGIASLAASITAFDCSMVGPNTVTLTVTDNNGNVATCDAIVTVVDTENPVITCPGDIVVNNDAGVCGTTVTYAAPTATDNCGSITSSELLLNGSFESGNLTNWVAINNPSPFLAWQVQPSFSYFNTVTPTDGTVCAGNGFDGNAGTAELYQQFTLPATGTSIFSWDDNLQYQIFSGAPRTYEVRIADATGTTLATLLSVSASGNSTPNTWISHSEDISAFNGQTIRIVFWQNIPGNYTGPGRFAVDNVSVLNNTSTINLAQTDATGLTTGDVFPIGTTTIEYTATDDSGNEDVCSFNVIVTDNEAPVATCQPITVQLDATGNVSIVAADVDGGSTDNCGIASMSIDNDAFTCANVGPNNVTLTVNDVNGNSSTCVAVVTVQDMVAPTAICQDITVQLVGGTYTMAATEIDNASNDACGIMSLAASQTIFGCGDVGVVPVTITVTDNNGNVSTCVANVTVEDNEAPIAACIAAGTQFALDANGDLTITGAMMDGGSTDDCGIASVTASPSVFTCADLGTHDVTLTVTDNNGNVSTCISNIEVIDNIAPVITCPTDIVVDAIVDNCGRTVTYNFDVVDACATITQTDGTGLTSGNLFPVGTTVQSYEVTDQTGTYTCTFNVTVNDVQDPIITNCPSNIVVSTDLGSCDAGVNWTEPIASDNCPAVAFTSTHSPGDVFALGTTTVTYTATDASGNAVTCSFTVTVNDNEAPLITDCTPDITVSNDAGDCAAIVTFAAPVYTENCTMGTEVASIASGSSFAVGTTPVTWTITDAAGNASTCTFNVIVEDTELPIAVCTDFTVNLDPTGNATITTGDIDAGSSDNCGIASTVLDVTAFDCSNVGTNPVVLTVTDIHGNVSTCSATVTVNDNLAPNALCAPITVQLDATGNVSINGADIDAGSNDNCGIASLVATPSAFTCAEVGGNVVTLTVTDVNGNTSTCVTTVTVQDMVAPIAACQDITVQLDASGVAMIVATDVDNGSSDACGIASMAVTPSSFTCANVGANTVTLTVTDVNGNVSTCTSTVTIEDNVNPTVVCSDITVQLDATGNASITPLDVDGGSSDACGISLYTINGTSGIDFTCVNVGPNNVTLAVTDNNGNVSTCTAIVTVEDNVAPVISCQDLTVYLDAAGSATITDADVDAGSSDACGIATSVIDVAAFDCSMVGPNTVTLTVTDVNSNVSTCTSVVTVVDTISPIAICQDLDIDLDATGNVSIVAADVDNGSNDACGIASIAIDVTDFDCSNVGPNTVILTVTDNNGNVTTCSSNVVVNDRVDPIALCQDLTVQLDATGNGSIIATQLDNGSSDACGIASYTADITDFDCSMVGANTVTLTVTDVNGNESTCTSTVTVEDNVLPTAICQDITVQLDATGNATIVAADVDNGSNDACGIVSTTIDVSAFDCSMVGANTVTLTVTDNNGNVSTCTSTVTVEDNVLPTAICQDITVQLDATGNATIVTADVDNGSNDACGIASTTIDISAFDCSMVGPNTVTLTVTDINGNVSTCTSTVTVEDNVVPVAMCQDMTVQLDATGNATIVAADVDNGSNDACGIASTTIDVSAFDCSMVGPNTVTLTVTDNNGNVSTCTSTVTVEDNVAPVALCQNITVALDATGNATIVASQIDNGSNDACGVATLAASTTSFDCSNLGPNTVTLTVTDVNGNVSTCDATVTIIDDIVPIITCPADVLVSNDPGLCSASSVAIGTAVATDNCTVSVTITNDAPAVFPVGVTVVTWTGVDGSGNSSTCTQNVTVEDVENPIITCPADVTVGNDAGVCEATGVNLGTPTVTDNCTPPFSVTVTNDAPVVFPVGSTNVTWTATDSEGNIGTCTQIVTVEDTEAPTITCPADVTVSTNPGICAAAGVTLGAPVTDDNCGVVSVTNDASGIFMLGSTTVTWTVTDAAGNSSTCTQIVTVEDTEAPVIACPIDVVVSSDAGSCDADALGVVLGTPITNDNCTVASVTNDAPSSYPLGNTTVTWTVTDAAGLTSTCTQMVTVMDTENPTITCPIDVTISADAGICDASAVVLGMPVTDDNCTIASVTNDAPLTFPLGNTTVTWTVTDDSGNMATCTQVVTVEDTEAPMIVCPADVTVSASGGICSASAVALGTPVTSDNCSIASITNDGLATYPLGTTTVTWTIVDGSGNTSTCTQLVTVEDTELPSIACSADIIVSADAGSCDATGVVLIDPVTSDNCSVANVTNDAPSAFPLGVTTVTWTVEDGSGNLNTCEQLVTVTDDEAPVITCPADVTFTADAGSCNSTTVVLGTPVTDDNCSVASVSNDGLAIYPLGNTTVTWTVVDGSGNTSTCTQIVTVTDDEAPTITCPTDVTITADAGACGSSVVVLGTPTTNDNCSVAAVTNDAPVVFPVGTTTVTWTVEDGSGNTTTCAQLVTVTDDEAPVVVCSPAVAANTDAGVCGATVTLTAPTALDNCGIATITNDAPVLFPVGMTTVTWTVTDIHGNVTTCTQDVDVTDTELPTVVCTADILVNNTPGYCGASVLYQTPIFDDNCGIVSVTQTDASGYTSGNLFPVGTTYIEYTAVDNSGNVLTCGFNVTVVDNQLPTLTGCPSDMTVYTTEAVQCEVVVNWTSPTAADNCPGVTMSQTAYSGSTFPLGMTTVTYDVTDNAGNTVSCSFNIEVLDAIHPTISMTDELTLVADDLMADSYQWVDCDNAYAPIVGETGSTYSATQNGNFAVIMTVDGCSDTTNCESITTVSIDEFALEALVLYPNPTMSGHFKVQYDGQIERIDVIDMLGRIVSLPIDLEEGLVDGSELANGKYMVRVITEHGMIAKEVIVLK